jgi:hypothetical protein
MPQQEAPVTNEPTQLAPAPQTQQTQPPSVGLVAQFRSISEVLATFPAEKFNLVLPLRSPRTPENYELWVTTLRVTPADCARLPTGALMPLKHKLYELAREAGVIVKSVEQILPSTWRNIVELAKELRLLPNSQHLSLDWIRSELAGLLHHRRNDVAVRATVLLEVAPGEFVQAIGTAEWIEEDERAVLERSVRRKAAEKGWDEDQIQAEIFNQLVDVRRFRLRLAETKALLRSIRAVLSLKTSYTEAELQKPFVIVSWRRVLSDEDLQERWRMVFGEEREPTHHTIIAEEDIPTEEAGVIVDEGEIVDEGGEEG